MQNNASAMYPWRQTVRPVFHPWIPDSKMAPIQSNEKCLPFAQAKKMFNLLGLLQCFAAH